MKDDERTLTLTQEEHDSIWKNSTGSAKGMWIRGDYISFASIASIREVVEQSRQAANNALSRTLSEGQLPKVPNARAASLMLQGIKDAVGETKFYYDMKERLLRKFPALIT